MRLENLWEKRKKKKNHVKKKKTISGKANEREGSKGRWETKLEPTGNMTYKDDL